MRCIALMNGAMTSFILHIANLTPPKITEATKFLWFCALLLHEFQHSVSYRAGLGIEIGHSEDWMWVQTDQTSFTSHNFYQILKAPYLTSLIFFLAYWMATPPLETSEMSPSSDISEKRKKAAWTKFQYGKYQILCATDAAGMGAMSLISSMLCPLVCGDWSLSVQLHNDGVGAVATEKHKLFP